MSIRPRQLLFSAAAVAAMAIPALTSATSAAPPSEPPAGSHPFARGEAAVARLGDRLPVLAAEHGLSAGEFRQRLLDDLTLAVDEDGRLAFFDLLAPGEGGAPSASTAAAAPPVDGPEFQLASLPGADKTIYLDFDGHVTEGTTWNAAYGITTIVSPPYDTNGNPDAWSAAELAVIADTWAIVAEDFAPWNVNVTTIDPGPEALRRSGSGDTQWGARVVITDDTFAGCGCGGHAYVGAFDDSQDEPTFVYNSSLVGVSEASSHEVGHMLGLLHDGTTSGAAYYIGHDTAGTPGWAPIMGAGYYEPVTHWSKQEYYGANNTGEDDVAEISSLSNGNNFGVRPDDHGDDLATATPISGPSVSESGIIETRTDVDAFSFTTGGGNVSFSADNAPGGPNLDIELTLRDSGGSVVAQDNVADGLDAALAATLAAGTYTVEIDGVGVGSPASNPPSGYTDYGSLGQYTLTGTIDNTTPPDTDPPAAPTGLVGDEVDGDAVLSWNPNGESDLAGYVVQRAGVGEAFVDIATTGETAYTDTSPSTGSVDYRVLATDTSGNRSAPSNIVNVQIPVDLTSSANGESAVFGTVSGSYTATWERGGAAQTITEVESGGKPSNRHDRAEHRWSIPASQGNQTLTVVASASDGGDLDDGFAIEWSDDGTTWIPLTTVRAGTPVDATFSIGAPTGTVWVRVLDTDRTKGQRSHDSVTIDFLEVDGDGDVVEPPTATLAVASLTTSQQGAGKGQQYGVATVQVNDDLGGPVAGANVTVQFSGDFTEALSGTTDASGTVVLTTSASVRKPSFSACVISLTASALTYAPGTEAC